MLAVSHRTMSTNIDSRLNWRTVYLLCICLRRSNNNIIKVFNRACAIMHARQLPLLALWRLVRQNSLRNMLAISHRAMSTILTRVWTDERISVMYMSETESTTLHAPRVLQSFAAPSSFHFFLQYNPPLQDITLKSRQLIFSPCLPVVYVHMQSKNGINLVPTDSLEGLAKTTAMSICFAQ